MRTYDTTGLVCPYCSHKHEPPFGLEIREPRVVTCSACHKQFTASAVVHIEYIGDPLDA